MRSSEATSSAPPRRVGTRLLLALALCACGQGGGGGDARDGAKADSGGGQAAVTTNTAPTPLPCDTTPLPDINPIKGQPWADLVNAIASARVTFPDSAGNNSVRSVRLCKECDTVSLQLRAANRTCGLDTLRAKKATLPLALLIPQRDVPAAHGWGPINARDTLFLFSPRGTSGPAQVAFRDRAGDSMAVALAPGNSWWFWYCVDEHPPVNDRSLWRNRDGSGPGNGPPGDDDGGGSYGWMACISGCCQFYTPPPNPISVDPRDKGRARGGAAANRVLPDSARPTWCPPPN